MQLTVLDQAGDFSSSTTIVTASVAPNPYDLLVIVVGSSVDGETPDGRISTVSGNGATWAELFNEERDTAGNDYQLNVWVGTCGASPSAGAVTVTFLNASSKRSHILLSLGGAAAVRFLTSADGNAANPSLSLTGFPSDDDNHAHLCFLATVREPADIDPGSTFNLVAEQSCAGAGWSTAVEYSHIRSTPADWQYATSAHYCVGAAEVIPVGPGRVLPTFVNISSALATDAATPWEVTPALPSGWQPGDIHILAWLVGASSAGTVGGLTGWTPLLSAGYPLNPVRQANSNLTAEFWWRRAQSGDTAPTVTLTTAASGFYAAIWGFRGCISFGTPFEGAYFDTDAAAGTDTTPDTPFFHTFGTKRLAVGLCLREDDTAFASGFPPTGWAAAGNIGSNVGTDCAMCGITKAAVANDTEFSVVVGTISAAESCCTLGLALVPQPALPPPDGNRYVAAQTGQKQIVRASRW